MLHHLLSLLSTGLSLETETFGTTKPTLCDSEGTRPSDDLTKCQQIAMAIEGKSEKTQVTKKTTDRAGYGSPWQFVRLFFGFGRMFQSKHVKIHIYILHTIYSIFTC